MQVKKQHLEPDMEQLTGSKSEKEYIKAVCCQPVTVSSLYSSILRVESLLMLRLGWLLSIPGLVVFIFCDYVINPLETVPTV